MPAPAMMPSDARLTGSLPLLGPLPPMLELRYIKCKCENKATIKIKIPNSLEKTIHIRTRNSNFSILSQ